MKKLTTFLVASFAIFAFATTASAQNATISTRTAKPSENVQSKENSKEVTKENAKETKVSSNTATKTAVSAEETKKVTVTEIEAYERKIDANRNNPNFDVKAAEAEVVRLKAAAGYK